MYEQYFEYRNVKKNSYSSYTLPEYVKRVLLQSVDSHILDIGCGFGQMIQLLENEGYRNVMGIDISEESVSVCVKKHLNVHKIRSIEEFCRNFREQFDFIIMSHILEHIKKVKLLRR